MIRSLAGLLLANGVLAVLGAALLLIAGIWDRLPSGQRPLPALFCGLAAFAVAVPPLLYAGLSPTPALVVPLTAALLGIGVHRQRRRTRPAEAAPSGGGRATAACLAPVFALLAAQAVVRPLSDFDAFADWTLKAKMLFGHGGSLSGALDHAVFAGDGYRNAALEYPLGLPSLEAFDFHLMGRADTRAIHVQFVVLLAAFSGTLWALLRPRTHPLLLAAGLALMLTSQGLQFQTLTAYADVPVACFWVASTLALGRWLAEGDRSLLALAALLAAAASAVKQEGLAFGVVSLLGATAFLLATRQTARLRPLAVAACAAGLTVLPWKAWVHAHGLTDRDIRPSLDLMAHQPGVVPLAGRELARQLLASHWSGVVPLAIASALVLAASRRQRRLAVGYLALLVALVATLVVVYWNAATPPATLIELNAHRLVVTPYVLSAALLPLLLQHATRGLGRAFKDRAR